MEILGWETVAWSEIAMWLGLLSVLSAIGFIDYAAYRDAKRHHDRFWTLGLWVAGISFILLLLYGPAYYAVRAMKRSVPLQVPRKETEPITENQLGKRRGDT